MANDFYVPQVDYTSRDFASIRDDLIRLIPTFAPQWTSRDSSDFGIVMLELFAYVGDILNYYIDRAANEGFVETATQRETVLQLARIFNYTPKTLGPSTGTVELRNGTAASITVPVGTKLTAINDTTGDSLVFETLEEVVVDARSNNVDGQGVVNVVQGSSVNDEIVGYSDGSPSQQFKISTPNVIVSNSTIYTFEVSVNNVVYSLVENLADYYPSSEVFTVLTDAENYTYLLFGDNTNGKIPPFNAEISVSYRVCDGALGNLGQNAILSVSSAPDGSYPAVIVVGSSATSGGEDPEDTDSIRENIPRSLRALNRAITLEDFEIIATQVPGVLRAKAIASSFSAVTLYVKAASGQTLSNALKKEIAFNLNSKTVPGITVTILDYVAVYPKIKLLVYAESKSSSTRLTYDIQSVLGTLFSSDYTTFNQRFSDVDIASIVTDIPGVKYVTVTGLEKETDPNDNTVPASVATMYGNVNEIFEYDAAKISIEILGGVV